MKNFINEFKTFAVKGNMVDMAVGIIIGGAFGKIVSSLVNDIVMPPIGMLIGGVDFPNLSLTLKEATETEATITINYGLFINNVIDFLIIAFVIFLAIKAMNNLKRKNTISAEPATSPPPSDEVVLLTEIRDLLKR